MRRAATPDEPLTVAHRAGNDLSLLGRACSAGVDLVEADVHWWRGRLEVRHWKTMGPIPLLWDKWGLAPGWTPRLELGELLEALPSGCEIMLDLKPDIRGGTDELLACVRRSLGEREYSVCSQAWPVLVPFHGLPGVRVIHSVGNERLLRRIIPHLQGQAAEGISIKKTLLSPERVRRLLEHVPLLMTWPVNREEDVRRLRSWGVNGFISDRIEVLEGIVAERRGAMGSR